MARIIHAEDDKVTRESMQDILRYYGHETVSVENGRDALDIIHQGGIDLLITDGDMPEMNGFELIARLSAERSTMPLLMLSGMNPAMMPVEVMQVITDYPGRALCHGKPPQTERLATQIAQLLNPANIPEYGIYTNYDNLCMATCEELTKIAGKATVKERCLCTYNGPVARTAISHPCDTEQCMNAIITRAKENPQTKFYIFALGKPERIPKISPHNAVYITNGNAKQKFMEIIQRHTDHILKQIKEP